MKLELDVASEPFNGGHVVLRLAKSIFSISREELVELKRAIDSVIAVESKKFSPEGFNILISDREVHVIPRWCGDVNVAFFGGMKIIPLSREDVKEQVVKEVRL